MMERGARLVMMMMLLCGSGCGPEPEPDPFPEGFPEEWTEARVPCRLSHDHDLTYIRVFADELAYAPYTTFESPYPPGARILKALYYDEQCEELLGYVTMEKLAAGESPDHFDWRWREFNAEGVENDDRRRIPDTCIDCHAWHCPEPPYGWDLTCEEDGPEPPP